ncbi:FAD-dependent oxidoreductase, partial [Mycobacterium sp.]|uniref:FAD-dependent oxidoreductase n=1 Tax=Mycobacterium sp. TaxID=1785 RepID=UPI003BB0B017
ATSVTDAVRQALTSVTAGPIFGAVGGGYTVLVEELVLRSRIRWVPAAVSGIQAASPRGWTLRDDTGTDWHADGVIVAVPAARLAGLLDAVAPRTAAAAGRIDSASSAVLAMAVPRGIAFPQNSGVLVASGERLHAKAITLSSRKWGRRTDVELLRLSFGRFGDDLATRASDDELLTWALDDLGTAFGLTIDPVDVCIQRWPDAMPQYGPGHRDLVTELRAGLPPTLAVAGSYLDGIGVPACIGVAGRAVTSTVRAVDTAVAP